MKKGATLPFSEEATGDSGGSQNMQTHAAECASCLGTAISSEDLTSDEPVLERTFQEKSQPALTAEGSKWRNAIHAAVWAESMDFLQALLAASTSISELVNTVENGCSPLLLACHKSNTTIASFLLEHGADPNGGIGGTPPIVVATSVCNSKLVQLLLSYGADPLLASLLHGGCTALHISTEKGHLEITIQLVLHARAMCAINAINIQSLDYCFTPLVSAVYYGQLRVVRWLLQQGADVNHRTAAGNTALILAANRKHTDICLLLIAHLAILNVRGEYSYSPLHAAVGTRLRTVVEALLKSGAFVDIQTDDKRTPLHIAAGQSSHAIVELLLRFGANPHAKDKHGHTPLWISCHNAARNATTETFCATAAALLDAGAAVEADAFHAVVRWGRVDAVQLLITRGANVAAIDKHNMTPNGAVKQLLLRSEAANCNQSNAATHMSRTSTEGGHVLSVGHAVVAMSTIATKCTHPTNSDSAFSFPLDTVDTSEADIPMHLLCAVCSDLLFRPATTPCGHTFCLSCISALLSARGDCPQCRKRLALTSALSTPPTATTDHALCGFLELRYPRAYARRRSQQQIAALAAAAERQRAAAEESVWFSRNGAADVPRPRSVSAYRTRQWMPDDTAKLCPVCGIEFSLFIRKHHFRGCGHIFCDDCTPFRIKLPGLGFYAPVRVCALCCQQFSPKDPMHADAGDTSKMNAQAQNTALGVAYSPARALRVDGTQK